MKKIKQMKSEYKPLLFTTTVRNPERIKLFLTVLKKYNNDILTNDLAEKIEGDLIRFGLYRPIKVSQIIKNKFKNSENLTNEEVLDVLADNPQDHKEAGFKKGWASRFDTHFKIAKELGFVFYRMDESIKFSDIGLKFADNEHPEFEQQAFLNAFVKYQSNNPFRRVLNENVPLVLLLSVIKKIDNDKEYNDSGISRLELPLILCWRGNDAESLYQKIKEIRTKYKYQPSSEVILEICDELIGGRHNSQKDKTIMSELPDEFIRKMRLTGLITIRGYGKFIDLNKKELAKIDYVISKYSSYEKYDDEESYFNHLAEIDEELLSLGQAGKTNIEEENKLLSQWVKHYEWQKIKEEILSLTKTNFSSKDEVLKFIPAPLRLEFLISLAVLNKYPLIKIVPNYISDDSGLPSSHAPGNNADIECYEGEHCSLLEVTLLNGTVQVNREMPPISRHLSESKLRNNQSVSFFIAPKIHADTIKWIEFIEYKDKLTIFAFSIEEFILKLEANEHTLYQSR
ncbi:MAG: AlwI family type II restriction endonuclease [Candidatus Falkowbacteria bacterium]